jgi:UDP-N-acetylglucosamine pyrophosphorylase
MLRKLADKPLPYHPAHKKIPYSRPDGESIMPAKPNAIKFETFIFDSFKECENIAVLRVDRNEEFAPIKNATGEDSPEAFYLQTRGIIDIP